MPAHFSFRSGLNSSKCDRAKLIFRSVSAVAITLSITAGLEGSFASGQSGAEFIDGAPRQVVNRMKKGDRLLEAPAFQLTVVKKPRDVITPRPPVVDLKLPVGCDTFVSFMADDRLARIAARCLS